VYVFQDQFRSGKDLDRPEFQELMNRAKLRLYDVAVFWKLDRFSRSLQHAVQIEEELRDSDVALYSLTEQIDTTTAAGRFNFRNLASAAEFEREMIGERSRMGLTALAMEGRWPNRSPPLGYDLAEDGRLAVNDIEAELVRNIFEEYLFEKSMPQVAQGLNRENIPTKRRKRWCARAVGDVLRNKVYIGEYSVAGISKTIPQYRIVDDSVFEQVTAVRTRFQTGRNKRPSMPAQRRGDHITEVIEQYRSFVQPPESVSLMEP
jgi:site-specific DNA recombinase